MKKVFRGRVVVGAASLVFLIGTGSMAYAATSPTPAFSGGNYFSFDFQVGAYGARACASVSHTATSTLSPNVYEGLTSISPTSITYGWFGVANTSCDMISNFYQLNYPNSPRTATIPTTDSPGEQIKVTAQTPANDPYGTTYQGTAES